jgi:uncharacterized protein YecT (DUF1311 family)
MRTKMMGLASGLIAITAGLALNASVAEAQNVSPTFNCNQRLNATERAICNNDDLAYLDQDMVAVYNQLPQFVNSSRWRQIRNEQRQWLKTRNSCGANVGCIRRTVNRRVGVLNTYMPGNLPDQPPQVFNPPPPPPPPPPPRPPVNQGGQGGIGGIFGNQPTNPPVQDVVAQYSCNSGAQVQVTYMNTSNPPTAGTVRRWSVLFPGPGAIRIGQLLLQREYRIVQQGAGHHNPARRAVGKLHQLPMS